MRESPLAYIHGLLTLAILIPIILFTDSVLGSRLQTTNLNNNGQLPVGQPNEVQYVNLLLQDNVKRHHTSQYRQISYVNPYNVIGPSVVLRRGESLNLVLHFRQQFNASNDKIRLEFIFGPKPQLDKGTLIYLPVEVPQQNSPNKTEQLNDYRQWRATATQISGNKLNAMINIPTNLAIGVWRLRITTKLNGTRNLRTFTVPESLYILFNAWNENDEVYLAREDARQEYILTDVGKIYIGSYTVTQGRKWTYGQFHEAVLPSVMLMLDRTRLDIVGRADVVRVSRAVSAMVNSHDDNGLLVGNWSGRYGDGLAPWQWTGSPNIFEQYYRTGGRPVKFGQCWVFGGVTTTALRALGIPARTISNFVSAHDTDLSLTVDKFYSEGGGQLEGINGDSIWNFHVWSDAWMARKDLPPGYGGWQAIDATPQETSMGMYQLGPASLEAIKQGKVGYAYDVGFVYSEVNADLVHWVFDSRTSQWRRSQIMTYHVGRKILTKMIGVLDERTRMGNADAEDIVGQYKFKEGSPEERQSYREAIRIAGLDRIYGAV